VGFFASKREELNWGFIAYDKHRDVDVERATLRRNFYVIVGRAACKACSATWNLDIISEFALGPSKATKPLKSKSKLYYGRRPVGQSVLVSGTHLGPATNFSPFFKKLFLDSYGFVDVGRPL
jgi:hypothetical protein